MERGFVVFGVLFLLLPLIILGGLLMTTGGTAFALTLALIALLGMGFLAGIAFVDVDHR